MKTRKLLLLVIMMTACSFTANAQLFGGQRMSENYKSKLWVDAGFGTCTGDIGEGGGCEIALRYTHMFSENVGWDVLKIGASTATDYFTEMLDLQAKTGVRIISPVIFGRSTLFANGALGYGFYTDGEQSNFGWEAGAGLNISPRFAVGVVYSSNMYSVHGYHSNNGLISLRVSIGL
ncbi:MAG: hypothetical protein IJ190_01555 [Prevotella sp.]|nr:hypothetical protein [Prevotella sp.]